MHAHTCSWLVNPYYDLAFIVHCEFYCIDVLSFLSFAGCTCVHDATWLLPCLALDDAIAYGLFDQHRLGDYYILNCDMEVCNFNVALFRCAIRVLTTFGCG